jgi:hypothetical protein
MNTKLQYCSTRSAFSFKNFLQQIADAKQMLQMGKRIRSYTVLHSVGHTRPEHSGEFHYV